MHSHAYMMPMCHLNNIRYMSAWLVSMCKLLREEVSSLKDGLLKNVDKLLGHTFVCFLLTLWISFILNVFNIV